MTFGAAVFTIGIVFMPVLEDVAVMGALVVFLVLVFYLSKQMRKLGRHLTIFNHGERRHGIVALARRLDIYSKLLLGGGTMSFSVL